MFAQAADFLFDLIDGGRQEREDPDAISRTTAESIGGGIFSQIYAGVLQPSPPSEDPVPELMYAAVLALRRGGCRSGGATNPGLRAVLRMSWRFSAAP